MAVSTPTSLGSMTPAGANATTSSFATTAAVPAGGKIIGYLGWAGAFTISSVSGGGLSWTVAPPLPINGGIHSGLIYADAPAGLASSTTLTVTFTSTGPGSRFFAAVYVTGAATGGPSTSNSGTTGTTNWTSGTMTVSNGGILIGGGYGGAGTTSGTNTPTNGNTELFDQNIATDTTFAMEYQLGTGASAEVSGTWSVNSSPNTALGVVFDAAAGAAVSSRPLLPTLHKFSPLGRPMLGFPLSAAPAVTAQTFPQEMDATAVVVTAAMQRQANKILSATAVGVTASLQKQVSKILSATAVAVTASIQKQVSKALIATAVVVTATLQALKVIVKALTATAVVVTASIQKQVNKPLTATTIVVTASMQRQVNKTLAATSVVVTATLQALKVIVKALTATAVVVTATITKQINKPLTATAVAVTASLQKQVNKTLRATNVAVTASLQALKVIVKALTATAVVVTATMSRQVQLHLSAPVAVTASITKKVTKTLTASAVVVTGTMVATFGAIATFLTGSFDSLKHRLSPSRPADQEFTADPEGNMGSDPRSGEFD